MTKSPSSIIIFFAFICLFFNCCSTAKESSQRDEIRDSVFASYQYQSPDGFLLGINIELRNNNLFHYSESLEHLDLFSEGDWEIVKDTLILNSSLSKRK